MTRFSSRTKTVCPAWCCTARCTATAAKGWPKVATPWFEFTGLQTTTIGAQKPIAVSYVDTDNAIVKGLENWTTINEELYNNEVGHVQETAHPLAHGKQDYESKDKKGQVRKIISKTVVVWTNLYNGKARVFGTTLGHTTDNLRRCQDLDLVTAVCSGACDKLDAAHMKPAKKST